MARLLFLTNEFPPYLGGIATYARELALAAHLAGHDVSVLAPRYGDKSEQDDELFNVIRHPFTPCQLRSRPIQGWHALKAIRQLKPDLVHAVDFTYVAVMAWLSRLDSTPYQVMLHGTEILHFQTWSAYSRFGLSNLFTSPRRIVTNSQFTRRLLLQYFPNVNPDRVVGIPLGVDRFWFTKDEATESRVRERFGLRPERRMVLTVARLDERKGHRTVLRGLGLLPPALRQQIDYVVVGNGGDPKYVSELQKLAQDMSVSIVFTGGLPREEVRACYGIANAFCMPGEPHPGRVEGFGLAYLEAAAQGLPAIASRIGGVPEVVRHNETGIVVEPLDIAGVGAALTRILSDESFAQELGASALIAAQDFTWEQCAATSFEDLPPVLRAPRSVTADKSESEVVDCVDVANGVGAS